MVSFNISNRDEIEWIVKHDPQAVFDVYEIGRLKTYKSLRRNVERVLNTDGVIVGRLTASKAAAFEEARRNGFKEPPPKLVLPRARPAAAPRPRAESTLLPKVPLPPHLQGRKKDE